MLCPGSTEELAAALREAGSQQKTITLSGNSSKRLMAGPIEPADTAISTVSLNRILQYEPRDLTISVEAGLPYRELSRILAENRQMIPLDPPFFDSCTVGGVIASNVSGSRRRLYGTARDMVIGMQFVTLEGKIVQSGGMVVKNVAGLDMAKMMIGSFGTLAAIAVVNFKLQPLPEETRTFVLEFSTVEETLHARDAIHKGVLQPVSLDIVKSDGHYRLLVHAAGNSAVIRRYSSELSSAHQFQGEAEQRIWSELHEFTPSFLASYPQGAIVRIPCPLSEVGRILASLPGHAIARAGSGVVYGYFDNWRDAIGRGVVEYAPDEARAESDLWPVTGSDFAIMKKVKDMFDPHTLLNRRRLYGRI